MSNQIRIAIVVIFFLSLLIGTFFIVYQFFVIISPLLVNTWYKFFPNSIYVSSIEYDQPQKYLFDEPKPNVLGISTDTASSQIDQAPTKPVYEVYKIPRNYYVGEKSEAPKNSNKSNLRAGSAIIIIPVLNISNLTSEISNDDSNYLIQVNSDLNLTANLKPGDIFYLKIDDKLTYAEIVDQDSTTKNILKDNFTESKFVFVN